MLVGVVKDSDVILETHDVDPRERRVHKATDPSPTGGYTGLLGIKRVVGTIDRPTADVLCRRRGTYDHQQEG